MAAASLPVAALAMAGRGFCFEICRTATVTLLQTSVPDGLRGRVMSTQFVLQQGAGALGVALVGAVAADTGLRLPVLCGTGLAFLVWAATLRMRGRGAMEFGRPEGAG